MKWKDDRNKNMTKEWKSFHKYLKQTAEDLKPLQTSGIQFSFHQKKKKNKTKQKANFNL